MKLRDTEDPARFACTDCGARSATDGDCGRCGEGPLVDLDDPEVREALRKEDESRAEKHQGKLRQIAIVAGIVSGIALATVVPTVLLIPFGNVIQAVLLMVLAAFASLWALGAMIRPPLRYPYLAEDVTKSIRGSADAMKRDQAKGPLLVLAGLSGLGLLLGGLAAYAHYASKWALEDQRAQASQAWADLQQCAIGAVITDRETLHERVRLAELAGAREGGDWPARCGTYVTALYEATDESPKGFGADLRRELDERFGCAEACKVERIAEQLTELELVVSPLVTTATSSAAGPKMIEADLLTKRDFPQVGEGDAKLQDRDVLPDGTVRLLLNSYRSGLMLCEIEPGSHESDCAALRLPLTSSTVALVPQADVPSVMGRRTAYAELQTFGEDGEELPLWAGRRDGFSLHHDEGRTWVVSVVEAGEATHERALKMPRDGEGPWLAGEQVIWIADGDGGRTLFARPLHRDDQVTGEREAIGPAPSGGGHRICRSGSATAVLLGRAPGAYRVALHDGTSWSYPDVPDPVVSRRAREPNAPPSGSSTGRYRILGPTDPPSARAAALRDAADFGMLGLLNSGAGGDPAAAWGVDAEAPGSRAMFGRGGGIAEARAARRDEDDRPTPPPAPPRAKLPKAPFVCGSGEAVVTWRDPGADDTIHELACTRAGCTARSAQLRLNAKSFWITSRVGRGTLVVWQATSGEVRSRWAPIDQLHEAPDQLIMDDQAHSGPGTLDLEAFPHRAGVVFSFRGLGLHGLVIDAEGKAAPLR